MKQPQIKVFVTKNFEFRAKVNDHIDHPYEVTIGSKSWTEGKGQKYKKQILNKIKIAVIRLQLAAEMAEEKLIPCPTCKKPRGEEENGSLICPCPHCGDKVPF